MSSRGRNGAADILLVDDDDGDEMLVREAFKVCRPGHRLHAVRDGEEAMAFLRREGPFTAAKRPHLILLDLNLPRKDGREVLLEVKTTPELKSIPVIVLTTSDSPQDVAKAYELHANCYIAKPTDLDAWEAIAKGIEGFWLSLAELPPPPAP
jgi:CheY-like chemotaxis protein